MMDWWWMKKQVSRNDDALRSSKVQSTLQYPSKQQTRIQSNPEGEKSV
jgi:hypothetical protein